MTKNKLNYRIFKFNQEKLPFYSSITTRYEISKYVSCQNLYDYCHKHHYSFFNLCVLAVARALNSIKEYRCVIYKNEAREYKYLSYVINIMKDDKEFNVYIPDINKFKTIKAWNIFFNKVKSNPNKYAPIKMDTMIKNSAFAFLTCLPFVDYNSFSDVTLGSDFFPPLIHWGKFVNGRMNVSINANHIFVYGIHLEKFYIELEKYMAYPDKLSKK